MFYIIKKIFYKINNFYQEENSLISREGHEILAHPEKRKLLREAIEHYKKTGSWELLDKIKDIKND